MADIATVTPELEASCRKLIADNHLLLPDNLFPAPGYRQVQIMFPSYIGGANWGGASFSPDLGYMFVNVTDMGQLIGNGDPASGPPDPASLVGTNKPGGRPGPFTLLPPTGRFKDNALNMPCNQPPWGELVAVNVNTGEVAWRSVLGVTDNLPADKQKTGRPSIGGSIVTAGGVIFIGATDDARFRAFDAKTGKELWATKLDAVAGSVPSTYLGKDGRQYVVTVAAGNGVLLSTARSDTITAFRLKR
jgi:quinoprotein glucose dehydrogenase